MSAFIISDNQLDYILTFVDQNKHQVFSDYRDVDRVGSILHKENVKSYNYAYGRVEIVHYKFNRFTGPIEPLQVYQFLECLNYQSCEHPDYKRSKAYKMINYLKGFAISRLMVGSDIKWAIE